MADHEIRDHASHIHVSLSERIVIRLPENATTGYQWSLGELPDLLKLESNDLRLPEGLASGTGGERVIVLRARDAGIARVALTLRRAWEAEPIQHFDVSLTIS